MPVVPYTRQVGQRATPNVRLDPNAANETFRTTQPLNLSPVTRLVAEIDEDQRRKADQVAVLAADNALSAHETSLLYDKDAGVLTRQGHDALAASADVEKRWTEGASKIRANLKGDQQLAFDRMAANRWQSINASVQRHVSTEGQKLDASVTETALDN